MIVAFGTSTPTSITVVATSTSSSPSLNCAHHLAPVGGLEPAVQQPDAVARELGARAGARPRPRPRGRAASRTPRSAGRRRTPAGPSSRCAHSRSYAAARALLADPRGHDRLAVRGRLRDLGHGEVAVDGQRERARDRRRRHVQDVRRAPLGERLALLDAEAVLLVDDRDGEVGELDVALDQRVRADRDLRLAARDRGARRASSRPCP